MPVVFDFLATFYSLASPSPSINVQSMSEVAKKTLSEKYGLVHSGDKSLETLINERERQCNNALTMLTSTLKVTRAA